MASGLTIKTKQIEYGFCDGSTEGPIKLEKLSIDPYPIKVVENGEINLDILLNLLEDAPVRHSIYLTSLPTCCVPTTSPRTRSAHCRSSRVSTAAWPSLSCLLSCLSRLSTCWLTVHSAQRFTPSDPTVQRRPVCMLSSKLPTNNHTASLFFSIVMQKNKIIDSE